MLNKVALEGPDSEECVLGKQFCMFILIFIQICPCDPASPRCQ